MCISKIIVKWYHEKKRDLPWRKVESPYHIWISEIILQQTRVNQGLEYYNRFIEKYPTVIDLANAPLDEVLKMWQGLGYYTRARNLHLTAQNIAFELNGRFPRSYQELIKLKGIGSYTAAAIASIAFKEPVALVDGNVSRVLSRLFCLQMPVDSTAGKHLFEKMAADILDPAIPGIHNQALMELGALICLPKNPVCSDCPLVRICKAYAGNKTELFPVKSGKIKQRIRYFNYLFIHDRNFTYVHKRSGNDIWNLLYEFPLIESDASMEHRKLTASPEWFALVGDREMEAYPYPKTYKHQLTHQTLYCTFYSIDIGPIWEPPPDFKLIRIPLKHLSRYAVPRIIEKYLDNLHEEGIL